MGEKTVPEIAKELVEGLKSKVEEVKELNLKSWKGIITLVTLTIRYVESVAKNQEIIKQDKKELAMEIVDQLVDVPYLPDFVEGPLLKFVTGLLIDQAVETLNRTLGKEWITKVN